jgi:hypothetical protein
MTATQVKRLYAVTAVQPIGHHGGVVGPCGNTEILVAFSGAANPACNVSLTAQVVRGDQSAAPGASAGASNNSAIQFSGTVVLPPAASGSASAAPASVAAAAGGGGGAAPAGGHGGKK